jgi:hypothetical protein
MKGKLMKTWAQSWTVAAMLVCAIGGAPAWALGIRPTVPIKMRDIRSGDRLYPINVNNYWGYMTQTGDVVIYPQLQWADYFYDGFARVMLWGKTGYIKGSSWSILPRYEYADRFAEGYAVVGDGKVFGFIDRAGREWIPPRFAGALRFKDGFAAVQVDGRVGFIDRRGAMVIEPRFVRARSFHDGVAVVQLPGEGDAGGEVGYIDKAGRWTQRDRTRVFDDLGDFNEGFAKAKVGEKWGYINRTMRLVIDPRFDDARDFTGGVAAVKLGELWGYIDKRGTLVVEARYDLADDFDDVWALVKKDGLFGYVDRAGRSGITPRYGQAEPYFLNYARVSWAPNFGYIAVGGKVIWNPAEAEQGFLDLTLTERGRILVADRFRYNFVVPDPQPYREPMTPGYPPDYLYDEELPAAEVKW